MKFTWTSEIVFLAMDWRVFLLLGKILLCIVPEGELIPIKNHKTSSKGTKHLRSKSDEVITKKGSIRIEGPWSSDSGLDRNVDPMEDSYVKKVIASNEGLNFNKDIAEAGEVFDVNGIEDFYDKNALITYEVNGHEIPVHMKPKVTPQTQQMFPEYGHDSPNDFSQSRHRRPHHSQATTFYGLSMKDMPEYGVHDTPPYGKGGETSQRHGMHRQPMEEHETSAQRSRDDQFLRDQQIFHGDIFHKAESAKNELPWKTADSASADHQTEPQDDKFSSEYSQAEEIAKVSSKLQSMEDHNNQESESRHSHRTEKTSYFHRPDPQPEEFETDRNSNHFEGYNNDESENRQNRYAEGREENRAEEVSRLNRPKIVPDDERNPVPDPNPASLTPSEADSDSHVYPEAGHNERYLPHEYQHYHSYHSFAKESDRDQGRTEADPTPYPIEREQEDSALTPSLVSEHFNKDHSQYQPSGSRSEDKPLPHDSNLPVETAPPEEGAASVENSPSPSPSPTSSESESHGTDSAHFDSEHPNEDHYPHQISEDSSKFFEQLEKLHESKEPSDANKETSDSVSLKQEPSVSSNTTKVSAFMEEAEKSKAKERLLSILGELTSKLKGMEDTVKDTKKTDSEASETAAVTKDKENEKVKETLSDKTASRSKPADHEDISDKVSKIIDSYQQNDKPFITNTELIDYKAPDVPEKAPAVKVVPSEDHKHNQDVLDSLYQAGEQQQRNKAEHHEVSENQKEAPSHTDSNHSTNNENHDEGDHHDKTEHHADKPESETSTKTKTNKSSKVDDDYPDYNEVKDAAIFEHNYIRKKYHSSTLSWSDNLSDQAQKLADELGQDKFMDISKVKRKPGENIAIVKLDSLNVGKDSADAWASESNSYDFVSPILTKKNTDFVQMAWKSAKEFGIGVAKTKDNENWIVVSMYDTPVVDDYKEIKANVLPDQPLNDPYEDIIG